MSTLMTDYEQVEPRRYCTNIYIFFELGTMIGTQKTCQHCRKTKQKVVHWVLTVFALPILTDYSLKFGFMDFMFGVR